VIRYKMVGTHRAPFLGVPATGVRINVDGAAVYKIVDDRLTESWDYMDLLTLYRQLNIPLFKTH
ncbi:MAG TPA: ester cyclase, partial [Chitinophaga sp.]|uniref:ester cyclase n=1 Tax=Chitinophaga sp. TaxID=1869181 RepID=UPI002CC9AD01